MEIDCFRGDDEELCSNIIYVCPSSCNCSEVYDIYCRFERKKDDYVQIPKFVKKLTILDMEKNDKLSFKDDHYLIFLNVTSSPIDKQPELMNLTNLVWLDLSFNSIISIKVNNLKKLQRIYLNNNPLMNINENSFKYLNNLIYLDLSNTKLNVLGRKVFFYLENLEILTLNNLKFKFIHKNTFERMKNLQNLFMNGTQFKDEPTTFLKSSYFIYLNTIVFDKFESCCFLKENLRNLEICLPKNENLLSNCKNLIKKKSLRYSIFALVASKIFLNLIIYFFIYLNSFKFHFVHILSCLNIYKFQFKKFNTKSHQFFTFFIFLTISIGLEIFLANKVCQRK